MQLHLLVKPLTTNLTEPEIAAILRDKRSARETSTERKAYKAAWKREQTAQDTGYAQREQARRATPAALAAKAAWAKAKYWRERG